MNERVRHGLDMESLLSALPPPLRDAPALRALAATAAKALSFEAEEVDRLRIYTRLDRLPEELLDILAYDFKVDWWNPDYTLEEKRRVLRDSWYVHRHMGTRAAVETALKAVYRDAAILEGFEYGGQPGYFRLWTDVTNEDFIPALRREILRRMNYYKRLGAHLESAGYYMKAEPARAWAYAAYGGQIQKRWAEIVPPPGVRPPEAEVTAIYGGVLAGMAGSAERAVTVPAAVGPPVCEPSLAAAWACHTALRGRSEVEADLHSTPPRIEATAVYGGVLAIMIGALRPAGTGVELGI